MMKLPDWLLSALSDGSTPPAGQPASISMTRLLAFITVLSVVVMPALAIVELSLFKGAPVAIPDGWNGFVTASVGAVTALFICNKRAE